MYKILKSVNLQILVIVTLITLGCGDRGFLNELNGKDRNFSIPSNSRFILRQMDTLKYVSGSDTEIYYISHLIEGKYYEGTTGTCGKSPFDIFEFQAIYIRPVDSIDGYFYADSKMDDCDGHPRLSVDFICM